jgi:predicted DNA-binding transcriptional regulator AlpA
MANAPLRLYPADADPPADGNRPTVEPLLATAKDLAVLLRLSLRTIRSMDAGGRLPEPVRVGGSVRWRLDELRAWLDAGAPDRATWARIRDARS